MKNIENKSTYNGMTTVNYSVDLNGLGEAFAKVMVRMIEGVAKGGARMASKSSRVDGEVRTTTTLKRGKEVLLEMMQGTYPDGLTYLCFTDYVAKEEEFYETTLATDF